MDIPLYQVDAFASAVFGGNPAAVCPLAEWLPTDVMQAIAAENNLSETAFIVPEDGEFAIRWFTPVCEVDLCGHATLAGAYVVFQRLDPGRELVRFDSRSGPLAVRRDGERLVLDFPARATERRDPHPRLAEALGGAPVEILDAPYAMAVYGSEREVRALAPDFRLLAETGKPVIATATGDEVDFVSRFFAPTAGIDEDPVTGSAHCTLTPYWSRRLGKKRLVAHQVSARGGELFCEDAGERTFVAGNAALYLEGTIHVP